MGAQPEPERRGFGAAIRLLFEQAFSDRSLIDPGEYAAYNLVLGLLLLVLSALLVLHPERGTLASTIGLAAFGLLLVSAPILLRLQHAAGPDVAVLGSVRLWRLAFSTRPGLGWDAWPRGPSTAGIRRRQDLLELVQKLTQHLRRLALARDRHQLRARALA